MTGESLAKQYLPISFQAGTAPVVIYPAKDDAVLEKAFPRDEGTLERYVTSVIESDSDFYQNADMILAYVWNQEMVPYVDMWKINRNDVSDDSGFLYDVRIYKDHEAITDVGVASGNSLIVLAAEELLLRDLVVTQGLSFAEAAQRQHYPAYFSPNFTPTESFYKNL